MTDLAYFASLCGAVSHFVLVMAGLGTATGLNDKTGLQKHRLVSKINLIVLAVTVACFIAVLWPTRGAHLVPLGFAVGVLALYAGVHFWFNGVKHPEGHGMLMSMPALVVSFAFVVVVLATLLPLPTPA